jgi:hypothetical protein
MPRVICAVIRAPRAAVSENKRHATYARHPGTLRIAGSLGPRLARNLTQYLTRNGPTAPAGPESRE